MCDSCYGCWRECWMLLILILHFIFLNFDVLIWVGLFWVYSWLWAYWHLLFSSIFLWGSGAVQSVGVGGGGWFHFEVASVTSTTVPVEWAGYASSPLPSSVPWLCLRIWVYWVCFQSCCCWVRYCRSSLSGSIQWMNPLAPWWVCCLWRECDVCSDLRP